MRSSIAFSIAGAASSPAVIDGRSHKFVRRGLAKRMACQPTKTRAEAETAASRTTSLAFPGSCRVRKIPRTQGHTHS
jgi:hypothetical protein